MRVTIPLAATIVLLSGAWALLEIGTPHMARAAGGCLVVLGLPLLGLTRRQLGKAFSIAPQAKGLVTHGLYARIPHPMYVFLDVVLLGIVLIIGAAWLLVPWAGLVAVQAWQAGREARVLEQAFGDAYRQYRKRTWW